MLSIKQRQLNLRTYMYYYKGNIDGKEEKLTKKAYVNFQKKNNLKVDGIYGIKTEEKLLICIKDIQSLLNKNLYNLLLDGIVGNITINCIKEFQNKHDLIIDGIVGEETYRKLKQYSRNWSTIKYFKYYEFTCPCGCKLNNIEFDIVKIAEDIRRYFKRPVIVTSGCRCIKHNVEVGGVYNSKHLVGKAIDVYVTRINQDTLYNYCKKIVNKKAARFTYKIKNSNAVHIDID